MSSITLDILNAIRCLLHKFGWESFKLPDLFSKFSEWVRKWRGYVELFKTATIKWKAVCFSSMAASSHTWHWLSLLLFILVTDGRRHIFMKLWNVFLPPFLNLGYFRSNRWITNAIKQFTKSQSENAQLVRNANHIQTWFKNSINQHIVEYKSQWCVCLSSKEILFNQMLWGKSLPTNTLMHGRTLLFCSCSQKS